MSRTPRHPIQPAGRGTLGVLLGFIILTSASCTEEVIRFRDRDLFNPPADSANGFLGYFDVSRGLTACGNCHIGTQGEWEASAHAGAFATLEASGHAQDFCYGCHTVSELGNDLTEAAGWNAVQDTAYHDVQCESCHGPGLAHVQNPEATQPLASIAADTGLTYGCADCHTGDHHPFVEQWKASAHGSGSALEHAGARAECAACHEGRAAIAETFNADVDYLEKDDTELQHITCAVCHDPHGSPFEGQLRASVSVPSRENLCVTCHSRNATPWSSRGPHAAQGLLVLGISTGWIPPGFAYDTTQIASSHGTFANPRLCATCHVDRVTVSDAITGDFVFESVGHLFEAVPCVDTQGIPTTGPCTIQERDFSACATSGCHLTEPVARNAYQFIIDDLNLRLDQIWSDTDGDGVMEETDAGLLPDLIAAATTAADSAELDVSSSTVTVAKGTLWNAMLASTSSRPWFQSGRVFGRTFSAHPSAGNGVHNPFLLRALLVASIQQMISTYGLAPPPGPAPEMSGPVPPGVRLRSE